MKRHLSTILLASLATATAAPTPTERGKEIYAQICMTCHGPHMEGGIGPALTDPFWKHGDTPEAINRAITKGITGTEMMAFEAIYPAEDRQALTDYILSKQQGIRSLVREYHKDEYFKDLPLTTDTFKSRESSSQKAIPENVVWMENSYGGAVRYIAKLYVENETPYSFQLTSEGKSVLFINGEQVCVFGKEIPKEKQVNTTITLKPGAHDLELLHISKRKHGHRISGNYGPEKGPRLPFHGRSLQGNEPKFIMAEPTAKVARKWIKDISPRSLLLILPNSVIVAYNPTNGEIENAWHTARINQTPSLSDRSAASSEIQGQAISGAKKQAIKAEHIQFKSYESKGDSILIHSIVDDQEHTLTIKPEGSDAFSIQ